MLDCIIVGTGPAGLSAAINLKTYGKDFLWFGSRNLSEKVEKAEKVVNYPGFPEITGKSLAQHFQEHIAHIGLAITEKTVTMIMASGNGYMVLADNEMYEARTLILAMGVMNARQIEGEQAFLGRGVSYCATCDGMFYKGKRIAIVCNAPKYEHEVEYLADLADEVLYYPTFESKIQRENVRISKDRITEIRGGRKVDSILLRSGIEEAVDGVFCLRNAIAPANLIPGIGVEKGHITVDRHQATNLAGCFACGDCTGRPYQYTKAVGEGNVAAHAVISYLAGKTD